MKKSVVIVSLVLTLSACAQIDQQGVGSLAGGAVGGLLGSQFGGGAGKIASAVAGTMIGAVIGGQVGKNMDRVDKLEAQQALETAPTGHARTWKNPDTGNQYSVKPTRTYQAGGQPCREYVTEAVIGGKPEKVYGKACRQADGSWKIVG